MRYINIIIYLLLFTICKSQNLVPNSGFEIYSTCPTGSNQLTYATGWTNPTTAGTSDFFNRCSPTLNNFINSYQTPKSGNGYAGFATYGSTISDVREYVQINLLNVLINNKCYLVTYYLSAYEAYQYRTNNIGALFSVGAVSLTGSSYLLNYIPQVLKFNNPIIPDTLNWVEVKSVYNSSGGENFLTIGNFKNDALTNTIIQNSNAPGPASYYFIDDISVIPIDSIIGGILANAGPDKNIAIGDSVFIGQEISNLNCNWSILGGSQIATNTSGIYVQPLSPTTYVVEQNLCGAITYDTVFVMVSPTMLNEYNTFSNSINVFPNPTTNNFIISYLTESSKLKVEITDTQGKLYSTELITISNNKATIKTNLTNGVYFVSITDIMSSLKVVKKLVVQK